MGSRQLSPQRRRLLTVALSLIGVGTAVFADGSSSLAQKSTKSPPSSPKASKPRAGQSSGNTGKLSTSGSTLLMGDQTTSGGSTSQGSVSSDASFAPASLEAQDAERQIRNWGGVQP